VKDLKRYNKFFYFTLLIIILFLFFAFLAKSFSNEKAKFFYLTSDLSIKSERQILPSKYDRLELVRFYFSGPIDVKKFKKDYFQQLDIDNVYYIDNVCKIILSNDCSSIFQSYSEEIKKRISEATIYSLKNNRLFKKIKRVEFFIYNKIKIYSYDLLD